MTAGMIRHTARSERPTGESLTSEKLNIIFGVPLPLVPLSEVHAMDNADERGLGPLYKMRRWTNTSPVFIRSLRLCSFEAVFKRFSWPPYSPVGHF